MKMVIGLILTTFMMWFPMANAQVENTQAGNAPAPGQRTVLITGATRGIGLKTTEYLSKSGYFVFAGARKDEDMQRLDKLDNVKSVRLDVNVPEQIAAAVQTIEKYGAGLYGLVNNAGIAKYVTLNKMPEADFDAIMQVNVYGPFRVTKAFAPLLKAQKGRIVNISSVGGVGGGAPGMGAYAMSKHALEAYSDTLALEMRRSGVRVSVIEPGNYGPPDMGGGDKLDVAKAVEEALSAKRPKKRYLVVPEEKQATRTIEAQFQRILDLNEQQKYSMDLDELTRMLEQEYKKQMKPTGKKS
jgi:NAD(P)-dependent dehydrogenase (short-subunit alcohol dehydrogenase family)